MPGLLTLGIVASLALHLRAEYFGPAWQVYLFKPLTTSLVIALAAVLPGPPTRGGGPRRRWPRPDKYRIAILAGLGASLAGDVFLMLPGDAFTPGLASFLVAHLCYVGGFVKDVGFRTTAAFATPYGACFVALMAVLLPRLGPLTLPVIVYGLALVVMGWQAAERWKVVRSRPAAGAAIGGALFVISDSALAINRFVEAYAASTFVVMTTYVAAQWLIARSVAPQPPSRGRSR